MEDEEYTHKFLIQINYKSGISMKAWFYEFNLEYENGAVRKVKYVPVKKSSLFMNIDEIESVWKIKDKEIV